MVTVATVKYHIKTSQEKIAVGPLMIFLQNNHFAKKSDADVKEYFKYEFSPFTFPLSSEKGMRKATKSTFYLAFIPL